MVTDNLSYLNTSRGMGDVKDNPRENTKFKEKKKCPPRTLRCLELLEYK